MVSALEALDGELNSSTYALLGDTVTYTRHGELPLELLAIVDYGGNSERLGNSRLAMDEAAIEVPMSLIAVPNVRDVIDLPKRPGERFNPKSHLRDESGMNWLIVLKKAPD